MAIQQYLLAAPKIKKYAELKGTLAELLSNAKGTGGVLERLIAVPILPSATIASVETSSKEVCENKRRRVSESDEEHVGTSSKELHENKRQRPYESDEEHAGPPLHQKPVKAESGSAKDEAKRDPATFPSLPMELHRQILDYLVGIVDTVCLGLTSQYFWAIARDNLHKYYASYLGHWAGQNIIFVGDVDHDFVTDDDDENNIYPPELFTEEELALLPTTRHHFTTSPFAEEERFSSLLAGLYTQGGDGNRYDPAIEAFRELVAAEEATYYPQDKRWILRNLTMKEFVRSEAIALKPEFIHGPFIDGFGFGQVLISRICWSTFPCDSMECEIPIHRGIWAGHEFDITTLERHEAESRDEEWDDVSEEVTDEIPIICERIHGPDWREIICKQVDDGRGAS